MEQLDKSYDPNLMISPEAFLGSRVEDGYDTSVGLLNAKDPAWCESSEEAEWRCQLAGERVDVEFLHQALPKPISANSPTVSTSCTIKENRDIQELLETLSSCTLASQPDDSITTSLSRARTWRLELPGDTIGCRVNEFANYVVENGLDDLMTVCPHCYGIFSSESQGARMYDFRAISVISHNEFYTRRQAVIRGFYENVHWSDRAGNTALHYAAALGVDLQSLTDMIRRGAPMEQSNTAGQSFLHVLDPGLWYDSKDAANLIRELTEMNFDFTQVDILGQTFLSPLSHRGYHPLDFAKDLMSILRELDEEGRLVNYRWVKRIFAAAGGTDEQWTELGWYESQNPLYGRHACVGCIDFDFLIGLSTGALATFKDYEDEAGRNCLHIATSHSSEQSHYSESAHVSLKESKQALIASLLSSGIKVDHRDISGETPMMALVRSMSYNTSTIDMLLGHGANIDARDHRGCAALHISISLGQLEATRSLLKHGANVHVRNIKGQGVLLWGKLAQRRARSEPSLHARIEACIALTIDAGAVDQPGFFDEWGIPDYASCHHDRGPGP